ncbi:MAG: tryptophan synthase subunit alpha, partial [Candidatus Marinimicrobia bacterium]|nr:tryptophan synthase subunit alpha [Candidatus Neomarinimicrobiota bacterium]
EEDPAFFEQAREAGLSTIFLVAPNTGSERMVHLGREAGDLLYAVSIMGVTGTALSARQDLTDYLKRVRLNANVPFVVGFGIATPQDVRRVGSLADGVVVGSALLQRLAQASDPPAEAYTYLHSLAAALP